MFPANAHDVPYGAQTAAQQVVKGRCRQAKHCPISISYTASPPLPITTEEADMKTKTNGTRDDDAATSGPASTAVLEVANLTVRYKVAEGYFTAVDNVSFSVAPGERVAIVGESGSGKTNTCLAIAGVLNHPNAVIEADAMTFK